MTTLLIDTATDAQIVAIADDGVLRASRVLNGRAQQVLDAVHGVLEETGATVSRIGVGVGPGTFTGLRVGVTTARGLACAWGVSLAGIDTLAAVAASADDAATAESLEPDDRVVWASISGGRGERFLRSYRCSLDGITPASELQILPEADVDGHIAGAPARAGAPTPAGLVRCLPMLLFGDPMKVVPEYGREPDATQTRATHA